MATEPNEEGTSLSPDEAFAVVGNETRMEILQTLLEADKPLEFSELRDRVGMRDSGQFNYHLGKLAGHFVENTDRGYSLRQAGRRVVEAVLAGAITDDPVLEPTQTEEPCPYCDTPILVAYQQERFQTFCPECQGHYEYATDPDDDITPADAGYLGSVPFPPAGLQGRTVSEVRQAANTWGTLELLAIANQICPRCSAPISESVHICEGHEISTDVCAECGNRHAIQITRRCTNCLHEQWGAFVLALMANNELLTFLSTHGINPVAPPEPDHDIALMDYDEEVLSVEPFKARFTFTIDDDVLTLTVDDDLNVVEVRQGQGSDSG